MKLTQFCSTVFVGAMLALLWASPADAVTYFVDQGHSAASDGNAGTGENLPWKTLKKATNSARAGDTVIVKKGTYTDTGASANSMMSFQVGGSGTANAPILFKSEPLGAAVIGRHTSSGPAWGVENRNYIIIDGFKVLGALGFRNGNNNVVRNCEVVNGSIIWGDVSLHWGIYLQDSHTGLIENNYVHDMDSSGNKSHNTGCIMIFGRSYDSFIQNNTVDGNNKTIYNAYGTKGGGMDRCTWRFNIATNCVTGFMGMGSTGGGVTVSDLVIYQNVVVNCTFGIELYKQSKQASFYNNTIYGADRAVQVEEDNNERFNFWNNLCVTSSYGLMRYSGYPGPRPFSDMIAFSDYNSYTGGFGRFALREKSPTINYSTLAAWRSGENFDLNSNTSEPGFINPGGNVPDDYKRGAYPANGRGGAYAAVMGAYITGNESIGHDYSAGDTIGFASPRDFKRD